MKKRLLLLAGVLVAGASMLSIYVATLPKVNRTEPLPVAKKDLEVFIAKKSEVKEPKVQDTVSRAHMRLGYLAAKEKDWPKARESFLEASRVKGTGEISADFGSLSDQAAYQAAVTLMAEGRKDAARQDFQNFMKERELSPLVHAVHKRLVKLNGGQTTPALDAQLQRAVTRQEEYVRFETSVCGPRIIAYVLDKRGKKSPELKTLAKLCGTTDNGTTIEGMRDGLKKLGQESFAFQLDRRDFAKAKTPFILLEGNHYVAVLSVSESSALVYDSRGKEERTLKLPDLTDPDFSAPVILFESL